MFTDPKKVPYERPILFDHGSVSEAVRGGTVMLTLDGRPPNWYEQTEIPKAY